MIIPKRGIVFGRQSTNPRNVVETKMNGEEVVYGESIDTIEWGFINEISSITYWFQANYEASNAKQRALVRQVLEDSPTCPSSLAKYMRGYDEVKSNSERVTLNEDLDEIMWFRLRNNSQVGDNPLGDFDEIYLETSDLGVVDDLVRYMYGCDAFSPKLFDITIFDGDGIFERYVNSSNREFKCYSRDLIAQLLKKKQEWEESLKNVNDDEKSS